jgi:hypothetical protein
MSIIRHDIWKVLVINLKIDNKIKLISTWLILGPVLALLLSTVSWSIFDHLSPGKLSDMSTLFTLYHKGLLLSLLTPWGWLMYGGFLLMNSNKLKAGISCTLGGAALFGIFWPIWAADITLSLA